MGELAAQEQVRTDDMAMATQEMVAQTTTPEIEPGSAGNALISVYDKEGIVEFAAGLVKLGWNLIASGGTEDRISDAGIAVMDVAELVGGKAILGHRVVTLSREVGAGLLADMSEPKDLEELEALGIPVLGMVCVDMYPLEEEIAKPDSTPASVRAKTDIGGPTMLREGAKGGRIVLSLQSQRQEVLVWLQADKPDEAAMLGQLEATAEYEAHRYTGPLVRYLGKESVVSFTAKLHTPLAYGENKAQVPAGLYADNRVNIDPLGLDQFEQIQGNLAGYNNYTDIDRMLQTATHIAAGFSTNFGEVPALAIAVKHGNSCGTGVGEALLEAVEKAIEGDTRAIFGGLVMVNGEIDAEIATALMDHANDGKGRRLLDGVVASSVTDEALLILNRKKLRVFVNPALASLDGASIDQSRKFRQVRGGVLAQPNYTFVQDFSHPEMAFHGEVPSEGLQRDALLAWAIGCTSNSNTITLVKDGKLIGNGVGQHDRIGAGQLAITRTTIETPEVGETETELILHVTVDKEKLKGTVAYSDSFYPFPDGPALLAKAGVKVILTSRGSVQDEEVMNTLNDAGVSVMTMPDEIARGFFGH